MMKILSRKECGRLRYHDFPGFVKWCIRMLGLFGIRKGPALQKFAVPGLSLVLKGFGLDQQL